MCTVHDTQTYFLVLALIAFLQVAQFLFMVGGEERREYQGDFYAQKSGHLNPVSEQELEKLTFDFSLALDFQVYFASLFVASFPASVSSTKAF